MEDIDPMRAAPGSGERIVAALNAFGLVSDEAIVWQSDRLDLYESAFNALNDRAAIYPCHCSRRDLVQVNGVHPSECVGRRKTRTPAWRLCTHERPLEFNDTVYGPIRQSLRGEVGDFVLRRADGVFAYQLALVVDDAEQHIDEVVRGPDLLDSTPRQIYLQTQLDLPIPNYPHLPLALDASGHKLSKQERARPADPSDPLPALHAALTFLGQSIPSTNRVDTLLAEASERFDSEAIPRSAHKHAAMRKD